MHKILLVEDLSTLSTIAVTNLNKLTSLSEDIISHAIYEARLKKEPIVEIDVGIGSLYILISDTEVKYKFIPSAKVQKTISYTIKNNKSKLIERTDETLGRRITNTYKDIL